MAVETARVQRRLKDPTYQAFFMLRTVFTVAPILMGIDKFFNWMVRWPSYLAPWINRIIPGTAQQFMYAVGVIEILAGLLVLLLPRYGALIVAGWLGGIIINLLTNNPPEYYDIALRDFGLMVAALVLVRLAWALRPSATTRTPMRSALDRAA
jgi:uncharacterized membrane protein YphA (DoxX/SURF4 family)